MPLLLDDRPGRFLDLEHSRTPEQLTFDALGTPLSEVTFVVVDLETTGGRSTEDAITEIGAVKLRGGVAEGEFQTLVNPQRAIPREITTLTGISSAMVASAPPIDAVLPAFLEFARFGPETVLVAHNARFDAGFLKAACQRYGIIWPHPFVVDTVMLSRRALSPEDTPNHKLATLARVFGTRAQPTHRALDDARATGEILHRLLERLAPLGLTHYEDLHDIAQRVPAKRRAKSRLAESVPAVPGVYQFISRSGEILYVGSSMNLHTRVKSYFTAAERRLRMGEMLDLAHEVRSIECATLLEAQIRELRLIDQLQPSYNVRSRRARTRPWLRLTREHHSRLTVTRTLPLDALDEAWGPFASQAQARAASEALATATGMRTCSTRLPLLPRPDARECAAKEMGRCSAPCVIAGAGGSAVAAARVALSGEVGSVVNHMRERITALASMQRYEEARDARETLRAVLVGASRAESLRVWARQPLVIGARPGAGVWEITVARWGRLAGVGVLRPGASVDSVVEETLERSEHVPEPHAVGDSATAEETRLLATWFTAADCRLARIAKNAAPIACNIDSAARVPLPPVG